MSSAVLPTTSPSGSQAIYSSFLSCCDAFEMEGHLESRTESTDLCTPRYSSQSLYFPKTEVLVFPTSSPRLTQTVYPSSHRLQSDDIPGVYESITDTEKEHHFALIQRLESLDDVLDDCIEPFCIRELGKKDREISICLPISSGLMRRRSQESSV